MPTRKILLVEDEEADWPLFERLASNDGHVLVAVRSIKEAEEVLLRDGLHVFDVVITDGVLPDGRGPDLVRQLQAAGFNGLIIARSGSEELGEQFRTLLPPLFVLKKPEATPLKTWGVMRAATGR